jgi:ABC-type spermidine/putrescine transport system permease subunit I
MSGQNTHCEEKPKKKSNSGSPLHMRFSKKWIRMVGLMVGPFGWVFLFTILPMIMVFLMSFWKVELFRVTPDWRIDNYVQAIKTLSFRRLLFKTFWNACIIGFAAVGLSYPLAYFIARITKGKKLCILF